MAAGVKFELKGDLKRIERSLTTIQRRVYPKARQLALNTYADRMQTPAFREASRALKVKVSVLRQRTTADGDVKKGKANRRARLRRASPSRPYADVRVYTGGIPLNALVPPGQRIPTHQKKNRGKGLRVRGYVYKGVFLAPSFKGRARSNAFAFKRKGKSRLPLYAPKKSVYYTLDTAIKDQVDSAEGRRRFSREVIRQIRRLEARELRR